MAMATSGSAPLDQRLRGVMRSWTLPIDSGCQQHLDSAIQQAMQRVQAEGVASDPAKLLEAETNFRRLLTEMTRQAGQMGLQELHEPTYFQAMASLCPLWPFC